MEISTFESDLFSLRPFADRLEKFINTERDFVDESLVISLSSKFGSGKTTFLNMWTNDLSDPRGGAGKPLVIRLNAWESDYYGDPLFAIVSALVDQMTTGEATAKRQIIKAVKDVGWLATAVGNQIVRKATGVDLIEAGQFADEKQAANADEAIMPCDTFSVFQDRRDAMKQLKDAIGEFVTSRDPYVLFLVDELDRCRPDYAISYLETIKHIFDIRGAVFILAADRRQLENSAKTAFGYELDFEEYYRKFIHREVALPPISREGYAALAKQYVEYYLERDGVRACFMQLEEARMRDIRAFIGSLQCTPRQIQEVFRILGHVLETSGDRKGKLPWCLGVGCVVMAALKVSRPKTYRLLGTKQLEPTEAIASLREMFDEQHTYEWWFRLFLTGGGLKRERGASATAILQEVGLIAETDNKELDHDPRLGQFVQGWGHSDDRFAQIYRNIEQVSQWE